MANSQARQKSLGGIVDLSSRITTEGQAEAESNLKRYVELVWRICERLAKENPRLLTEQLKLAKVKKPRGTGR